MNKGFVRTPNNPFQGLHVSRAGLSFRFRYWKKSQRALECLQLCSQRTGQAVRCGACRRYRPAWRPSPASPRSDQSDSFAPPHPNPGPVSARPSPPCAATSPPACSPGNRVPPVSARSWTGPAPRAAEAPQLSLPTAGAWARGHGAPGPAGGRSRSPAGNG